MDKNPKTRLGSKGDMKELMDHPYFKGINFEKLLIKGYKSPFRPKMEVLTLKQKDLLSILKKKDIQVIQGKLVIDQPDDEFAFDDEDKAGCAEN